jgi:hypothetical protein
MMEVFDEIHTICTPLYDSLPKPLTGKPSMALVHTKVGRMGTGHTLEQYRTTLQPLQRKRVFGLMPL